MKTTTSNQPSCTAIVCAYHEEKSIAGVLDALIKSPLVDEIIVVDDGSEDDTAVIIQTFTSSPKIVPIFLPQNQGKGYAMAEGILAASGETLFFVDADLLNLSGDHITKMLDEWGNGRADMLIGHRDSRQGNNARTAFFRALSGERVMFRADIMPLVETVRESRFGVETLINLHYQDQGKTIHYVKMDGLFHPTKTEKVAFHEAIPMFAEEGIQIGQAFVYHHVRKLKNDWRQWSSVL